MSGAAESARAEVIAAAEGLLYGSEIDAPFSWTTFPAADLSAQGVAGLLGEAPESVREQTLEKFFARHIERVSPADAESAARVPRYANLRDVLARELAGARAFRVGEVEVRCLVLGRLPDGSLGGVETRALET